MYTVPDSLMEYVCFQQLDIAASSVRAECRLLNVNNKHSHSRTDRIGPSHALATGLTRFKITYSCVERRADAGAEHIKACVYLFSFRPSPFRRKAWCCSISHRRRFKKFRGLCKVISTDANKLHAA